MTLAEDDDHGKASICKWAKIGAWEEPPLSPIFRLSQQESLMVTS
jgi:hypothetical protein